jgi:hypothetical protein
MRETLRMEGHISLALGLHARPGSVAVLLGAGASASAGILTAWQVRQELIRQVARAKGDGEVSDAEAWWAAQPDVEATGYGDLLASLAPTAAGRRDLLRQFFEPTEDEREVGLKQPGVAHRALARLVATGAVKIVLTLNFDRLAENAIREAGVEPVVLSSPDAIAGSDPLQHQEALVVHLHGDYLSPETLNTPAELETYDVRMRSFLDEVFDRYGLLVVGWSAKWDAALRARLQASRTRRYGTWWVDALALGEHARDLAVSRDASVSVREAGSYLAATADAVSALADQRLADPVAPGLAVAYAKRALVGPGTAVPLHDNVRRELDRVAALEPLTTTDFNSDSEEYERRRDILLAGSETLSALLATCAYWGNDETDEWWVHDLARLGRAHGFSGLTRLMELRLAPATLAVHAAGLAAVGRGRLDLAARLLAGTTITGSGGVDQPAVVALNPSVVWSSGDVELKLREWLRPLLEGHLAMGALGFDAGWEHWSILVHAEAYRVARRAWQPLLVVDGHEPSRLHAAPWLMRQIDQAEDGTGILSYGLLSGTRELAHELLVTYESVIGTQADEDSWAQLPPGGGALHTGLRYIGRPGLAVPRL